MPTIPLLKPSTELAMPQVPALDRVPRPQIDVRGVLDAMEDLGKASMRRPVDAEPFVQAAGAKGKAMGSTLESVGSALTDVSSLLGALAQKRAEESNRVGIIKAQSLMEAGSQEVQDHFDKNPDKPESFLHRALYVGGTVVKGLGHILGLDRLGHHAVARHAERWHRELVAGAQAASDKQIFRNSADAQVAQFNGLMDRGQLEKAGALMPAIRASGVVHEKDLAQMDQRIIEVGGKQEVGKLYAAMREPGFTLEKGNRMVDGFQYVPKERREQVKADLTIAHAEFTEQTQVTDLIAKDPSAAVAALSDRGRFLSLKPATRAALVKDAKAAREHMGVLAYTQSRSFVDGLDGEQLKAMTPRKLEEAMAGGKDAALWGQAESFHKHLTKHYLALKKGEEKLNDPEGMRALEAAIDGHVPDLDGPTYAAHLRMSIEHGFEGPDHDRLMKRLDGRAKARVPATTARAQETIYRMAYQDNVMGKVRVPVLDIEGLPQHGNPDELDFTGRNYASKLMGFEASGVQAPDGKPVALTQVAEAVKKDVDYQAEILSRVLQEKNAKEPFKNEEEAIRFVKDEAHARGWRLPGEQVANAPIDGTPPLATEPKKDAAQSPADLGPEQGIWMSPSLRGQADNMAREAKGNLEIIDAPTEVREALEANVEKTRRAYDELRITFPEGSPEFEAAARGMDAVHEKQQAEIMAAYRQAEEQSSISNHSLNGVAGGVPAPSIVSSHGLVDKVPQDKQYSAATMNRLKEMLPHIQSLAGVWKVDPLEVTIAIAEELETRKGGKAVLDRVQDWLGGNGMSLQLPGNKGADIGASNFAVHNAIKLLKHFESDSRIKLRSTAPNLPDDNVAAWLVSDRGTAYAAAMHLRLYHDQYDPLISKPLSQEDRLRMAVMFFRQGANFDRRYAGQMETLSKGAVKAPAVQSTMLDKHIIPAPLQGNTTPKIPQQGHDSYVSDYSNKIMQLQWLLAPPKK